MAEYTKRVFKQFLKQKVKEVDFFVVVIATIAAVIYGFIYAGGLVAAWLDWSHVDATMTLFFIAFFSIIIPAMLYSWLNKNWDKARREICRQDNEARRISFRAEEDKREL